MLDLFHTVSTADGHEGLVLTASSPALLISTPLLAPFRDKSWHLLVVGWIRDMGTKENLAENMCVLKERQKRRNGGLNFEGDGE